MNIKPALTCFRMTSTPPLWRSRRRQNLPPEVDQYELDRVISRQRASGMHGQDGRPQTPADAEGESTTPAFSTPVGGGESRTRASSARGTGARPRAPGQGSGDESLAAAADLFGARGGNRTVPLVARTPPGNV